MEENTSSAFSLLVRNYVELVSIFLLDKKKAKENLPSEFQMNESVKIPSP